MSGRHPSSVVIALMTVLGAVANPSPAQQIPDEVRKIAEDAMSQQDLAGLQLAVGRRGGPIIWSLALGLANIELAAPMQPTTRVPVASVMKALTGILFLRLEEKGVLDRSTDVRALVPEFPDKETPITLDALVGQTHGIRHYRDEIYPNFFVTHYERLADALPIFANDRLIAKPGARFTYSSYAYTLLGLAMERATKRSFEELLSEHVLTPAGIQGVCADDVRVPTPGRATCYSHYDFRWPFEPREQLGCVPPLNMSYNAAGGNRLASAEALVRFGCSVVEGKVVGEQAMIQLQTSQTLASGEPTGWSHGWFVIDSPQGREWRINGSNPGSWASLRVYPESGLVLAMTTNTTGRGSRERPRGLIGPMDTLRATAHRTLAAERKKES